MKCPKCDLINPATALRCDCGYDFLSKEVEESYLSPRERKSLPSRKPLWWAPFATGGLIQMWYSISGADQSHRFVVTIGGACIVVAFIELIRKLARTKPAAHN
jgi:hypothetical protein